MNAFQYPATGLVGSKMKIESQAGFVYFILRFVYFKTAFAEAADTFIENFL
jgi:hypothetical protein